MRPKPDITVLETHRPPRPVVRYVDQVVGDADNGVLFRFSSTVVRRLEMDVIHIHPGQTSTVLGTGRLRRGQALAAMLLVARLTRKRIALVQTLDETESSGLLAQRAGIARRIIDRATDSFIVLHEDVATPSPPRTTVIPHAHYRERFIGYPGAAMVPGRVLCAASETFPPEAADLAELALDSMPRGVTMRFVGAAGSTLTAQLNEAVLRNETTLSIRLETISDGALIQEIDSAELVIQPRLATTGDIHMVMLALSRDRPVLVPRSTFAQRLADAVGHRWVLLASEGFTREATDSALMSTRDHPAGQRPNLDGRSFAETSAAYARVFHDAVSAAQARSPRVANARFPHRRRSDEDGAS